MAEWKNGSDFNSAGHPTTFLSGQDGMWDGPFNQRSPIQETGFGNDEVQLDGFPSLVIPNESVHAQSASGFSSFGMNIPSGGHLQEIPDNEPENLQQIRDCPSSASCDQTGFLAVNDETLLKRNLGVPKYNNLKAECYRWNLSSGLRHDEALVYATQMIKYCRTWMCVLCEFRQLIPNCHLHHAQNCPVRRCMQVGSGRENSAGQQAGQRNPHDLTMPIHELEERNRLLRETSALDVSELYQKRSSEESHNCFPRSEMERDPNQFSSSDTKPKYTINTNAQFPQYQDEKKRYRTFNKWPSSSRMKPRELTKAGLFYEGTDDHCRCFHCGGLLRDWEDGDDPVEQHELWFPDCCYAQKAKAMKISETTRNEQIEITIESTAYLSLTEERDVKDRRQDPDICGVCDLRKTEVTQLNCKHIVCRDCLPEPGSNRKRFCRICSEEVVKTIAFDSKCKTFPG